MKKKMKKFFKNFSLLDIFIFVFLTIVFIAEFYPFFYTLFMAVMPYENYVKAPVHAWPSGFTTDNIMQVLSNPALVRGFRNSILRTLIGTVFGVIVTVTTGYVMARDELPGRKAWSRIFIFPMYFSAGIIPYYLTIRAVGLLGSFWAMIFPYLITPFNMFIARSNFKNYPKEIIEAAKIDGANEFQIYLRIILPTSLPLVATIAMLIGALHWNDFFWPSILVQQEWQTAPVLLNSIVSAKKTLAGLGIGNMVQTQSYLSSVASILIIPVLIAYPFVQKYLVKGVLMGSLKD